MANSNLPDQPIIVGGSALPAPIWAAMRYLIAMGGTFALSHNWVQPDQIEGIVTIVTVTATVGYGLWQTYRRKQQLIVTADASPNSVAKVV